MIAEFSNISESFLTDQSIDHQYSARQTELTRFPTVLKSSKDSKGDTPTTKADKVLEGADLNKDILQQPFNKKHQEFLLTFGPQNYLSKFLRGKQN